MPKNKMGDDKNGITMKMPKNRAESKECRWIVGPTLGNVERVEHKDVVVVFGERDYVALAGDLQSAAPRHLNSVGWSWQQHDLIAITYLDVWTLELRQEAPVAAEHDHVEPVAVWVPYQDVTRVWA